jgi:HEAT repeat protein
MRRLLIPGLTGALLASACARAAEKYDPAEDKRPVNELYKAMADELPDVRLRAARALGAKGPKVLPVLTKALKDKDWRLRRSATDGLAEMGGDANSAVAALAEALKDGDAWVRDGAASALAKVGKDVPAAARALAGAVTDRDPWVRESAMSALPRVTQDRDILLPAAVAAIKVRHSGWNVRRHAVGVLGRFGKGYGPAIGALLDMLEHPSEGMWDCTTSGVDVLTKLGAEEKAIPILLKMLKEKRRGSRRVAAAILGKMGAKAKPAVEALKEIAEKDPDKGIREVAKASLEQIAGGKKQK